MTAPRLARAGRSRFLICLGILILMVGFVAIFHSSQTQLDEMRQVSIRCEQQQESLSAQMQVVVDSKFRLDKSITAERVIHDQTKLELHEKIKNEKELRDKTSMELNIRFNSLQQHYKLLESQHHDLSEECLKTKAKQLKEINGLEGKVKNLQGQITMAERQKIKDVENWKLKYNQMENEKSSLEKLLNQKSDDVIESLQIKNNKLEKTLNLYNLNCAYRPLAENSQQIEHPSHQLNDIEKNFNAQIPVSEGLYKIHIKLTNNTKPTNKMVKTVEHGVINSVENFQMIAKPILESNDPKLEQNVLQEPPGNQLKSSTPSDNKKTSENNNLIAGPIVMPTMTPNPKKTTSSVIKKITEQIISKTKSKPVPIGVVPIPESMNEFVQNQENGSDNKIESNRYMNHIDTNLDKSNKFDGSHDRNDISFQNVNEIENGAHEMNDNNDFNIVDEKNSHKDHLQEVLEDDKINIHNNNNNAAEEDTNLYDTKVNDDMDLEIVNKKIKSPIKNENNEKLMNEIAGDQGKVPEYPDDRDLHMEEQVEEEDDDEYANPAAREQEPAVRN